MSMTQLFHFSFADYRTISFQMAAKLGALEFIVALLGFVVKSNGTVNVNSSVNFLSLNLTISKLHFISFRLTADCQESVCRMECVG